MLLRWFGLVAGVPVESCTSMTGLSPRSSWGLTDFRRRWEPVCHPNRSFTISHPIPRSNAMTKQKALTFRPTSNTLPSADHANVNASPPTSSRLTQFLDRTSQNRTVPSAEQLDSSASRTGLNTTCSMPALCPRSSVEYRACARSGFQIRIVRSAAPVAMSWPVGFHARVRILK